MNDELISDPYDRHIANQAAGPGPEENPRCYIHNVEYTWFDDGSIESGPGEPYLDCKQCRDEAAGIGMKTVCWDCTREAGINFSETDRLIKRKIVALGPVVEERRDPTQTYELECGHTVI